jgi:hypothetical protein
LKESLRREEVQGAVSAADVEYVVMDIPKYRGPVIFPGHPTWVPIAPQTVLHDRCKGMERLQLPLVLAWGLTIHKSQGLTFPEGVVVDFKHAPNYQPVATMGLAFVAMSRATHWERQAFRDLPDFWDFRKVLEKKIFRWRKEAEEHFDALHDATMAKLLRRPFNVDLDVALHKAWTETQEKEPLNSAREADLREMLKVRGVLKAEEHPDEPVKDRSAPKGGGGRKRAMGMRAPVPKKKGRQARAPQQDGEMMDAHGEAGGGGDFPDLADLDFGHGDEPDPCDFECGGFDEEAPDGFDFGGFDEEAPDGFDCGGFDDQPQAPDFGLDDEGAFADADAPFSNVGDKGFTVGAEMTRSHAWGDRYFEGQVRAECGQHALNNLLGGPQFLQVDLQRAARRVLAATDEREEEHIRPGGWYSHSVLATALRDQHPDAETDEASPWKLHFNRLGQADYRAVLDDELACGALVNQNNAHWIALVKHEGFLWHVDSQRTPTPMSEASFRETLRRYPDAFPVARRQRPGH